MRAWTLAEADASLFAVRALLNEARSHRFRMEDAHAQVEDLRIVWGVTVERSDCPAHAEFAQHRDRFRDARRRLLQVLARAQAEGIFIKDVETGLVDFPSRIGDQDVLLCWREGEPSVGHWHPLEGGFAGRQRVPRPDV